MSYSWQVKPEPEMTGSHRLPNFGLAFQQPCYQHLLRFQNGGTSSETPEQICQNTPRILKYLVKFMAFFVRYFQQ